MTTPGFIRPEILVEPEWLESQLVSKRNITVIDCDEPAGYLRSHIRRAISLGTRPGLTTRDGRAVIGPGEAARRFGQLGIDARTNVVLYDNYHLMHASRVSWVLRYYGHERVVLLDGGWDRWVAEDRPVESRVRTPKPSFFRPRVNTSGLPTLERIADAFDPSDHVYELLKTLENWVGDEVEDAPDRRRDALPHLRTISGRIEAVG